MTSEDTRLRQARDEFIARWGSLGSTWGISRAMSQIHALLLVSPEALSTDEVMDVLHMSRGSANTNLRELTAWGLITKINRKGDRRDYFEAEKDVWRIFCIIARERKRREIDPTIKVLQQCAEAAKGVKGNEARQFYQQIHALEEFVSQAASVMDKIAASDDSKVLPALLKVLR